MKQKILPLMGLMVVLAGLVTTMVLMVRQISDLFDLIKHLFGF